VKPNDKNKGHYLLVRVRANHDYWSLCGVRSPSQSSGEAKFSTDELNRRNMERRAVEAVIWGMPAVNYERMLQAAIDNGAKLNQVVYWSRPVNEKNQTLTPNPDTIYLNPF
jgi:hypothetical protein